MTEGKVAWRSPSNLAIVKYWGKYGRQLPRNSSMSLTLSQAYTDMQVAFVLDSGQLDVAFRFEGKEKPDFRTKIQRFVTTLIPEFPFLSRAKLSVDSSNSFPHSSGIASSASSMSALALCLCDIERQVTDGLDDQDTFLRKASHVARLGSGSASRSVYPHMAIWGKHNDIADSSDMYAIPHLEVADVFKTFHDDICIISTQEKAVSSTAGHQLMEDNPYANARYQQANDRMIILQEAIKNGDVVKFGQMAEDEALTLHGMMMCSDPSYMLVEPNTIEMINRIRLFRNKTGIPVYFSLDAGPNIHMLYPEEVVDGIQSFIESEIQPLCIDGRIIKDKVGTGPTKLL